MDVWPGSESGKPIDIRQIEQEARRKEQTGDVQLAFLLERLTLHMSALLFFSATLADTLSRGSVSFQDAQELASRVIALRQVSSSSLKQEWARLLEAILDTLQRLQVMEDSDTDEAPRRLPSLAISTRKQGIEQPSARLHGLFGWSIGIIREQQPGDIPHEATPEAAQGAESEAEPSQLAAEAELDARPRKVYNRIFTFVEEGLSHDPSSMERKSFYRNQASRERLADVSQKRRTRTQRVPQADAGQVDWRQENEGLRQELATLRSQLAQYAVIEHRKQQEEVEAAAFGQTPKERVVFDRLPHDIYGGMPYLPLTTLAGTEGATKYSYPGLRRIVRLNSDAWGALKIGKEWLLPPTAYRHLRTYEENPSGESRRGPKPGRET